MAKSEEKRMFSQAGLFVCVAETIVCQLVSFCVEVWILFSVFLICCITSFGDYTPTSFPGFSPTRPTELRKAGWREPWERG